MTIHIKPDWHFYSDRYNNKWASITICEECECTGMYEDCHPVHPCSICGGKRQDGFVGLWIKPKYTGFWPFRTKVKDGYWRLKNDH